MQRDEIRQIRECEEEKNTLKVVACVYDENFFLCSLLHSAEELIVPTGRMGETSGNKYSQWSDASFLFRFPVMESVPST